VGSFCKDGVAARWRRGRTGAGALNSPAGLDSAMHGMAESVASFCGIAWFAKTVRRARGRAEAGAALPGRGSDVAVGSFCEMGAAGAEAGAATPGRGTAVAVGSICGVRAVAAGPPLASARRPAFCGRAERCRGMAEAASTGRATAVAVGSFCEMTASGTLALATVF